MLGLTLRRVLMPERIFALLGVAPGEHDRVVRMFRDAGLLDRLAEPRPSSGLWKIELPDEEGARRLTVAAMAHGLDKPLIQRYLQPTGRELATAPLLLLMAGGPGTERGHPRAGTSYDDSNACPECGAGLVQISPLRVTKHELPKSFLATGVGDELLVHESVAEAVASAGMRGIALRPALDRDGAAIPWRQVVVHETLPPMLASSRGMIRGRTGLERPCTQCGRDGWFGTTSDPFQPVYPRSVLDTMPDAAWTFELFGTGSWATPLNGKRSLASRRLIVRPAFYRVLKPLGVRGVRWSPIRVQ